MPCLDLLFLLECHWYGRITQSCSLLNPLLSFEVFLKETFESSQSVWERRQGENIGKSDEKSTYDQFRIITTPVSLSPVWCKYEENCLTGDIYTRILIGHITSISKLSGFLPVLIFILLCRNLYNFTNYCKGPLHAAVRNFMWFNKMADCSWLLVSILYTIRYYGTVWTIMISKYSTMLQLDGHPTLTIE